MPALTDTQQSTLRVLSLIFPVFSFFGALYVVLSYWFFARLRSFHYHFLLFFLCVSLMGGSIADWVNSPKNDAACVAQAVLINFFDTAEVFWALCISVACWRFSVDTNNQLKGRLPRTELVFLILGFGMPTLLTIVGGAAGVFGRDDQGWCWLKSGSPEIWRYILFYGWVFAVWIFSLFVVLRAMTAHCASFSSSDRRTADQQRSIKYSRRLVPYIIGFLLVWIWGSSNRIMQFSNPNAFAMWIFVIQIALGSAFGFLVGIFFYWMHPKVNQEMFNIVRCKAGHGKSKKLYVPAYSNDPRLAAASNAEETAPLNRNHSHVP